MNVKCQIIRDNSNLIIMAVEKRLGEAVCSMFFSNANCHSSYIGVDSRIGAEFPNVGIFSFLQSSRNVFERATGTSLINNNAANIELCDQRFPST